MARAVAAVAAIALVFGFKTGLIMRVGGEPISQARLARCRSGTRFSNCCAATNWISSLRPGFSRRYRNLSVGTRLRSHHHRQPLQARGAGALALSWQLACTIDRRRQQRTPAGRRCGPKTPGAFYLDAHYSGSERQGEIETPICAEIDFILQRGPASSVVAVDDARCFGTSPDYPPLAQFLDALQMRGVSDARVANDAIVFSVPGRPHVTAAG